MSIKKARYVSKNIELNQEFYFASPETKMTINQIYNSSWFGSVMYDLSSSEAVKLESSYNRSMKIMLDLPYGTHRGLIEPISRRKHLKTVLTKRFLTMIKKMATSRKPILKMLLTEIESDVRSNTGKNLRMIMMETNKSNIHDIQMSDIDTLSYHQLGQEDEWRIEMVKYLLEKRQEHPLDEEDLEWLDFLCCD